MQERTLFKQDLNYITTCVAKAPDTTSPCGLISCFLTLFYLQSMLIESDFHRPGPGAEVWDISNLFPTFLKKNMKSCPSWSLLSEDI